MKKINKAREQQNKSENNYCLVKNQHCKEKEEIKFKSD